jgi:hypothetical protein
VRTIHKFPLSFTDGWQTVEMQSSVRPVLVAMQHGVPTLWCDVDADADGVAFKREFCVVGTGHTAPSDGEHVGSVIDGQFVWHIFERMPF